jgi:hypothetical protein
MVGKRVVEEDDEEKGERFERGFISP